ncbi:molybdopterin oxidoreductase family protein [bacterium]|nr:molybdopterin oxidoreductase family protein [bacterium]
MEKTEQIHYRACHLCEATCGLEIRCRGAEILSIKGDKEDPLSRGFYCPKALALKDIHNDPDRLRHPVKRVGDKWIPLDWEEALDITVEEIFNIREEYGPDAVGVYLGNPCIHNYGMLTHGGHFLSHLKTRSRFSATSLDQLPHHLVGYLMYGHQLLVPIADIDRTDYFLMIGANPLASNGSMMTVPDIRKRIRSLQNRGGKLVVIDPRLTETAKVADEHHFITPGSDAAFLLAMLQTLFAENLVDTGNLSALLDGLETVRSAVKPFTPERAETWTGIPATTIRRLARDLSKADRGVCYGRMGVSVHLYGTLCQWAVQMLNILTGNLDRVGGALFTKPAFDTIGGPRSRPGHYAAWRSRVSALPEFSGELPAVTMAEEMLTAGKGQIRSLFTGAANPVLTASNGRLLEKALAGLDFMVSLDPFINETTRFANIILPPTSPLEHDHFDIGFFVMGIRNTVRYNQPVFAKPGGALHDWEIYSELGKRLAVKLGVKPRPEMAPDEMIDFGLQAGPYSSHAGHPEAMSLAKLKQNPHGIDLGPLQPSLPDRLYSENKRINGAPDLIMSDLSRVEQDLRQSGKGKDALLLIGRRHLFSANSWLHNTKRLVGIKERCQLFMHPDDMADLAVKDGQQVRITSRVGSVEVGVKATDEVMKGVVSLPHGWGHDRPGVRLSVAACHPGVSMNDLTDEKIFDPVSGNASLNSVPVTVKGMN